MKINPLLTLFLSRVSHNYCYRIMKITLFLLFVCTFQLMGTNVKAQNVEVNIVLENITVGQLLKAIESQTDYLVVYSNGEIDLKKPANVQAGIRKVTELLDNTFKNTDVNYEIDKNYIIISKKGHDMQQSVVQQSLAKKIRGTVTDMNGEPIIGASVIEKGTTNGVITDLDGNFSFSVSPNATIVVSYVGYATLELPVKNQTVFTIQLKETSETLDEVVVVGYGIQKKVNVIGSIAAVDSKQLEARPAPSVSNLLTGQMSGVTITQGGGGPGQDGGTIRIRGVGSFGATPNPLVLVDGLPGSLDDLNPNDIESISVLKDASSAAIYGSRAANGVLLVKTKGGRTGKTTVSYNGYVGFNRPSELPDYCSTAEYAEMYNLAMGKDVYTPEAIQKYRDGSDPYNYPNERYLRDLIDHNALQTSHDLTVNGGNDKTQYMVSLGYLKQDGLFKHNTYDRYNARLNLTTNLSKNLTLTTRLAGMISKRNEPSTPGQLDNAGYGTIIGQAARFPGMWATKLADGSYGLGPKLQGTPLAWLDSGSFYAEDFDKFRSNIELAYKPIKGLTLRAIGGYNYTAQQIRHYRSAMVITGDKALGPSSLDDEMYKTVYKTFQAVADYQLNVKKHSLSALVGYTWEDESQRGVSGYRKDYPSDDVPYLDAGGADGQTNGGGGYDWAIMSVFGRLTYNYAERYLLEATMRYDGSSRFPTDSKFGLFPSVAVGWRLSEESFFKACEPLNFISNFKLKASYGILGNNNIGNYPYQSTYALGPGMNYVFNGVYTQGAAVTTYVDPTLRWEKTRTTDVGFESGFWDSKLTFNASYFYRRTTDILYQPSASYSSIFGLGISQVNTGTLENKGWEFELGYQDRVGKFNYHVNGNFSIIKNKVISLGMGNVEQPNGLVGNGSNLFIGYPMQMYYGYKTDGVFLTDDEVKQWNDQSAIAPNSKAGDFRYVDVTGDGKVDAADRTYLGSSIPKYTFGVNLGGEYKGLDFSILLQGVAGVKGYLDGFAGWAFYQEGNIQKWQMKGTWSANQSERYPAYPRLEVMSTSGSNNTMTSDFWTLNASYLKVRNIQVGYTLPKNILKGSCISSLRFYVSADNPFSFSNYRTGWDPEISTGGSYHPILSTYTFGLNLKF